MSVSRGPSAATEQFPDDVSHIRAATSGEGLLEQLRRGELEPEAYIQARIARATEGLEGLGDEQLAFVRDTLRHQLEEDPALAAVLDRVLAASPHRVA